MTDSWAPIDDDVLDDEEESDEAMEAGTPVEIVAAPAVVAPTHPLGVYMRVLGGREVWFHGLSATQLAALRRLYESTQKRVSKATEDDVARIVFDFNNSALTLIESLVLSDADVDYLRDGMLSGDIEVNEILNVLWPEKTADDDEDPTPVVKPKSKAKPARTTANAKRVKR